MVTLVEEFEVVGPESELFEIMRKLVGRIEREGVRGMSSMHFWKDPETGRLGAVISFTDPNDFVPHIEMLGRWTEFQRFSELVKLVRIRVHGHVPDSIKAFIAKFGGDAGSFEDLVAGFHR